jgi:hypothetical protein
MKEIPSLRLFPDLPEMIGGYLDGENFSGFADGAGETVNEVPVPRADIGHRRTRLDIEAFDDKRGLLPGFPFRVGVLGGYLGRAAENDERGQKKVKRH